MLKIVIVEDEEIIRRGLICTIDWLSMGAAVVGDAPDGLAALTVIKNTNPDVVLTDIKMPKMGGLELARKLQAENRKIQIVLLTSYADFSYAQEAVRLGVKDYLLKPIDEQELATTLARLSPLTDEVAKDKINIAKLNELLPTYKSGNPYVRQVLADIKRGYQNKISLEEIAAREQVSVSYLSRKLKEETGHTFGTILTQFRLQKSIELLGTGKWRVYEVAEKCGFSDYKNFCQVFKKYLATSPRAFMMQVTEGLKFEGEKYE